MTWWQICLILLAIASPFIKASIWKARVEATPATPDPKPTTPTATPHGDAHDGGHDDHHAPKEKSRWQKTLDWVIPAAIILCLAWAVIVIFNNHNDSLARQRLVDLEEKRITESDPTAFWWTLYMWDENKKLVATSPLVRFTVWTTQEMEVKMPLEGNDSKFTVFKHIAGNHFGNWHEEAPGPRGQYSGWFKLSDFPKFDGNITCLEGEWCDGPNGLGEPGQLKLVRGRLMSDVEKQQLLR